MLLSRTQPPRGAAASFKSGPLREGAQPLNQVLFVASTLTRTSTLTSTVCQILVAGNVKSVALQRNAKCSFVDLANRDLLIIFLVHDLSVPPAPPCLPCPHRIDRNKTRDWLVDWAQTVTTSGELDYELPYPVTPIFEDYGVVITFKTVTGGQIIPVGDVAIRIPAANSDGGGRIEVTRLDKSQTRPYDGENFLVQVLIQALSRVTTSGDPSNPEVPPEDIDFSNWGSGPVKKNNERLGN